MHSNPAVLIVGAGPSGLALALSLLRNGVPVRIIDKSEQNFVGQRGAGIQPRTLELYKILGILEEVERHTSKVPKMRLLNLQGENVGSMWMTEPLDPRQEIYRVNAVGLGQDIHQGLLRGIIQREYGVSVELGHQLAGFKDLDDRVQAHIQRLDGTMDEAHFEWIVGADGARSFVRKELKLTFLGESIEQNVCAIGDIEVIDGFEEDHWDLWGNAQDKFLTLRPYSIGNRNYYFFIYGGVNADLDFAVKSRENLIKAFNDIVVVGRQEGKKSIVFGDTRSFAKWTANVRMVDRFGKGRVFVVGDAAHVHSFSGAQGLNSGVQDSINLGWKMALVHHKLSPPSILESYTSERIPVIASILNLTSGLMEKTFKGDNKQGWVREWETRMFGVCYRGSKIVLDEFNPTTITVDAYRDGYGGSIRAGDRAPEAPGLHKNDGTKVSLYEVLSPTSHTVISFGFDLHSEIHELYPIGTVKFLNVYRGGTEQEGPGRETRLIDSEGCLYKHYNVEGFEFEGQEVVVIIRPDGYIGGIVRGEGGVRRYFDLILS